MENKNIPKHLAIILDGNGRWAQKRKQPRIFGHKNGADNVVDIALYAKERGIKYLTLYAFSTENWKRPKAEVDYLMNLLTAFIESKLKLLIDNKVRLNIIGDISILPKSCIKACENAVERTKDFDDLNFNIALNYGARDEIVRAVKEIVSEGINPYDIDEKTISNHLYTRGMPDPDLLIRTAGDYRVSNFLLYQIAYCELYFTPVLWPDFDKKELDKALDDFANRERRYGGLNESN